MSKKQRELKIIDISLDQIGFLLKVTPSNQKLLDEMLRLLLRKKEISEMEWFDEMGI